MPLTEHHIIVYVSDYSASAKKLCCASASPLYSPASPVENSRLVISSKLLSALVCTMGVGTGGAEGAAAPPTFGRSVGRSRTKKLSASGGFAPLTPYQGLCPWTPLGALPQTPVIGSRSTRSPWPRPVLAPPTFKHFQRP